MVELAKEAFAAKNFKLSAEIYERTIKSDGPELETLLGLADSHARGGDFRKAFSTYIRCVRFGKTTPANMQEFAIGLADFISRNGAELGLIPPYENPFNALMCGKCSGLLIEPVTLSCGHSFCHACIRKDQSKTCQMCGTVHYFLDTQKVKTNVTLWTIIEKFFHIEIEAAKLRAEGNEQFSRKHFKKAITLYTEAADKAPSDHLVISNRSHAYAALDKFTEALSDAELIVKLKPNWAKGYYRKGVALSGLSRHEEACLAFLQCLALDPAAETVKDNLAAQLHFLVNLCSEADGKHSELHETLGVSPLLLLTKLMPESGDNCTERRSAPSSRASSPIPLGAKSFSDNNLSRIADSLFGKCHKNSSGKRRDGTCESPEANKPDVSRCHLSFNPSQLKREDVECALCIRLLYLPIATPCGHVFCRHCLDRCLDHGTNCPLCKSSLSDHLAERRQATVDAIEKLIELCLPADLAERKSVHEDEITAVTIELKDGQMDVPVFVCTVGFPSMPCLLHIFEPRYRLMVRRAMETGSRQFCMCVSTGNSEGEFSDYGVLMEIRDIQYFPDGRSLVDTIGGRRIRVISRGVRDGYNTAVVELVSDHSCERQLEEMAKKCHEAYESCRSWYSKLGSAQQRQIVEQCGQFPREDQLRSGADDGPKWMWWMVAVMPLNPRAQLSFLQMTSLQDRLSGITNVVKFMNRQIASGSGR